MQKTEWTWLVIPLLILNLASCVTSAVPGRIENTEIIAANGDLPFLIRSNESITTNGSRKMSIVVQDILNDSRYPAASKGFRKDQVIEFDPDRDGRADGKAVVLFNLDIYAFDATDPRVRDPGPELGKRTRFTPGIHRNNPVVLEYSISDYRKAVERALGRPSSADDDQLGIYYYEPSRDSAGGTWFPVENLVRKGDIRLQRKGDSVVITILRWPVDDRVHVGN